MKGKLVRQVLLAAALVSLGGCSFQFAVGRDIYQAVEVNPLGGMIGVLIAMCLLVLSLGFLAGGGFGEP